MVYWFRPANHWNVIPKEVYEVLRNFYDWGDRLKATTEEKKK